ncbi:hypothetical protein NOF55_09680 [Rhizobiaceae bacterium BDR2-2]|uniref:Uncharacterized protein n=1 Tax=Ectorhizobium quercum TaxID=2965071 RepID=A0AAE3MZL9_9HYPH|nr:hypothetical protein [Ectorhizobium quercum]MCX8997376.1 hypothetical protein [Ectorhizobium quercum]
MLGDEEGARAIVALARFVKTLGTCARAPLSAFRPGSGLIGRDEVLVMGLVSSVQHRDRFTQHYCLDRFGVAGHTVEVAASAEGFALTLHGCGAVMKPLPARLLGRILRHVAEPCCERAASSTVH